MRVLIVAASLLGLASAFSTHRPHVAAPRIAGVADESNAHRNRRSTVVADGKANGTSACPFGLLCCCGVSQCSLFDDTKMKGKGVC